MRRKHKAVLAALVLSTVTGVTPAHADPQLPYVVEYLTNPPTLPGTQQNFVDTVTVAQPADDVAHPGTITEWWYVNIVDPVTKATFIIDFGRNNYAAPLGPDQVNHSATVWFDEKGVEEGCHAFPCKHRNYVVTPTSPIIATSSGNPHVTSSAGTLEYLPADDSYHISYHWNGFFADFKLKNRKPGVTVPGQLPGTTTSAYIGWTVPVLTSEVEGWLQLPPGAGPRGGQRIDLAGWKGYHDHNFGNFDIVGIPTFGGVGMGAGLGLNAAAAQQLAPGSTTEQASAEDSSPEWLGYDWGVSHLSNGDGTLFGGSEFSNGHYYGVAIKATSSGTRFCQSDIAMSNYQQVYEFTYPVNTNTGCIHHPTDSSVDYTGPALQYSAPDPFLIRGAGLFAFTESIGSTESGSTALVEHFRTLKHYGVN